MEQEPTYHLTGVIHSKEEMEDFEGPLNLILLLLSKNKIEIRDIQVSVILEQYLAYLDEMKALDLEIASEFVQMASHLLYIKTRMLLTSEEQPPDELELLISALEERRAKGIYAAVREVSPVLGDAAAYGALYGCKPPEPLPTVKEYRYRHETWELLRALSTVFRRGRETADGAEDVLSDDAQRRRVFPKRIVYPVRQKSREILLRLSAKGRMSLRECYGQSGSRSELVATFVSVLELCSMGHTRLIWDGDEVFVDFTGGDAAEILETI
ncbi:MAG: segregation/condensation protein A [Oscillospiraceae bacterium]|nr:segregation/condensation protein A [Oscillospiraceae bacterium]